MFLRAAMFLPSYFPLLPARDAAPPAPTVMPEPPRLSSSKRAKTRSDRRTRESSIERHVELADRGRVPFKRHGLPCKWWRVEVVFASPLTTRQERRLRLALLVDDYDAARGLASLPRGAERRRGRRLRQRLGRLDGWGVVVGREGVVADPWPESWPRPEIDGEGLIAALDAVGVPYRWRAAPYGRDCDASCLDGVMCDARYNAGSCDPVWTPADWVEGGA